jgi:hypothetical protein
MLEVLVVAGLVLALVLAVTLPWTSLLFAGMSATAIGLVFGVTTGFWYHVALGRTIARRAPLPSRWWLRPVPLHERLDATERRHVLPWFYAGGIGFMVTLAGFALIVLGIAVSYRQG